jgi:aspartate/methionine/tyrosine aminotransferase
MRKAERVMRSEYMDWAKTQQQARFNLATSGLTHFPLAKLPVKLEDLELSGPSFYGYEPLQQAIARKCQAAPECVVAATGTSMANHLAMAALLEPGDEVLIEHPTYELLISTALYLGAKVKRFPRRFETGFQLDPAEIERAVTPHTRMIALTNLHNPSGALFDEQTLATIGEIAKSIGARVLVDEVYLDAAFHLAPRSAFLLGNEFITTNSLTKVYGLSGLRCGWILAEPELTRKMWRLNDLFGVIPAHPAERLSVIALAHLDRIAARAKTLLEINRALLNEFLGSRTDLEAARVEFGTIGFPHLKQGSVESLCQLLRKKYETTVVPGKFFEMPEHFRVGIGCNTEMLMGGLERLGAALDELNSI